MSRFIQATCIALSSMFCSGIGASSLAGQELDLDAIMSCFVDRQVTSQVSTECARTDYAEGVMVVPSKYDPMFVGQVASALGELALGSDVAAVRREAANWLTVLAQAGESRPWPDATERIATVFDASTDRSVRHLLVWKMAMAEPTPQAVNFLLRVVRTEDTGSNDLAGIPAGAVEALNNMGELGGQALQAIALEEIPDQGARAALRNLRERE